MRALVPAQDVPYVMESLRLVRRELPAHVPLIGFCGAPFTLFCYLVGGKPSKEFSVPRAFVHAEPVVTARLLDRLEHRARLLTRRHQPAMHRRIMAGQLEPDRIGMAAHDRSLLPRQLAGRLRQARLAADQTRTLGGVGDVEIGLARQRA